MALRMKCEFMTGKSLGCVNVFESGVKNINRLLYFFRLLNDFLIIFGRNIMVSSLNDMVMALFNKANNAFLFL